MGFASFLLYFVLEVPEGPYRRVWYVRRAPLLLASAFGFVLGGVVSEIVQSFLPVCFVLSDSSLLPLLMLLPLDTDPQWKEFQWGDILANLLGASLFIYLAHLLHLRSRKRQELSSLYQPLSSHHTSTYRDAQGRQHAFDGAGLSDENDERGPYRHTRQGSNVWEADSEARTSEERMRGEAVFDIGDEDDEPDKLDRRDLNQV